MAAPKQAGPDLSLLAADSWFSMVMTGKFYRNGNAIASGPAEKVERRLTEKRELKGL